MSGVIKKLFSIVFVLIIAVGSCLSLCVNAEEADIYDENGKMNLDVVFVLDASGSMLSSDPDRIAIDAFNLFFDLCDESCGVGYSVYTHKLIASKQITDLSSKSNLENLKKSISKIEYQTNGDTDIALGLTEAMNIHSKNKNSDTSRKKAMRRAKENVKVPVNPKVKEPPKKFVPEPKLNIPAAKKPDYVDIPIIEHGSLESLIKKGPEDAFNTNADNYKSDPNLEALIKKGPDNPFELGGNLNRSGSESELDENKSGINLEAIIKKDSDNPFEPNRDVSQSGSESELNEDKSTLNNTEQSQFDFDDSSIKKDD